MNFLFDLLNLFIFPEMLIQAIAKHNQLISFDITELNLKLGSSDNTIDVLKSYIDC